MYIRLCKVLLVGTAALFATLVTFNNITDYNSNYLFVQHVLSMDTTFPDNKGMWRSLTTTWVHHAAYIGIILTEGVVAVICWAGAIKLWLGRNDNEAFNCAKSVASVGLVIGILLWFGGFMVVGGEWFLMWQSSIWNGQQAASRFVNALGIILIFLNMSDTNSHQ